jgi:hypothetical protein
MYRKNYVPFDKLCLGTFFFVYCEGDCKSVTQNAIGHYWGSKFGNLSSWFTSHATPTVSFNGIFRFVSCFLLPYMCFYLFSFLLIDIILYPRSGFDLDMAINVISQTGWFGWPVSMSRGVQSYGKRGDRILSKLKPPLIDRRTDWSFPFA